MNKSINLFIYYLLTFHKNFVPKHMIFILFYFFNLI